MRAIKKTSKNKMAYPEIDNLLFSSKAGNGQRTGYAAELFRGIIENTNDDVKRLLPEYADKIFDFGIREYRRWFSRVFTITTEVIALKESNPELQNVEDLVTAVMGHSLQQHEEYEETHALKTSSNLAGPNSARTIEVINFCEMMSRVAGFRTSLE